LRGILTLMVCTVALTFGTCRWGTDTTPCAGLISAMMLWNPMMEVMWNTMMEVMVMEMMLWD